MASSRFPRKLSPLIYNCGIVKDPSQSTQPRNIPIEVGSPVVRAHQVIVDGYFLTRSSGGGELVPQLLHHNELSLNTPLTALIAECLGQMDLSSSAAGPINDKFL